MVKNDRNTDDIYGKLILDWNNRARIEGWTTIDGKIMQT